jgi:nicotinate-nucleotide adenylyltransferase
MVDMTQLQAMYGGTFDPVHYGHLNRWKFWRIRLALIKSPSCPTTCRRTAQPEATSDQRRHMLELAIADKPLFILDDRELSATPSYSAQTLREWRQEKGQTAAGVYYWPGFAAHLYHLARL